MGCDSQFDEIVSRGDDLGPVTDDQNRVALVGEVTQTSQQVGIGFAIESRARFIEDQQRAVLGGFTLDRPGRNDSFGLPTGESAADHHSHREVRKEDLAVELGEVQVLDLRRSISRRLEHCRGGCNTGCDRDEQEVLDRGEPELPLRQHEGTEDVAHWCPPIDWPRAVIKGSAEASPCTTRVGPAMLSNTS